MAGRVGEFNKQITNARNSNDEFEVEIKEDPTLAARARRTSAALLAKSVIHGTGTKKHFTTITPKGLPPDLVGDEKTLVERQNVLIEPKGQKYEGARLPPFKPFKTISDEDNIHLLPGETGERARLNLLDTKAVTKKDVEEVRKAYLQQREKYPELYNKQQKPVEEPQEVQPEEAKKKGLFNKLFGKKKEPEKAVVTLPEPEQLHPPTPPKEEDEELPPLEEPPAPEPKPKPPPKEGKIVAQATVSRSASIKPPPPSKYSYEYETTSEESTSEEEEEEYQYPYYPYPYPQGQPQYPGFPGGYAPYFNQAYAGGFGPMQGPPCFNPCMEEIQLECCKKLLKEKGEGDGSHRRKPKIRKQQGLNFDFLPHDDLATEVTMTIEPDEPEPLQFAVENGIMPIICCYMPSSIAVQPGQSQEPSQGYTGSYTGSRTPSYPYYNNSYYKRTRTSQQAGTGSGSLRTDEALPEVDATEFLQNVEDNASEYEYADSEQGLDPDEI